MNKLFLEFNPGELDYSELLNQIKQQKIAALYIGAYSAESALIVRQARDAGIKFQVVSGDSLHNTDFWLIAGEASNQALFTFDIDPRTRPEAKILVERFRQDGYEPEGYTLHTYAAIQVWAAAVSEAETLDHDTVVKVMHQKNFKTVLGSLSFDLKGDLNQHDYAWYRWQAGKPVKQ